MDVPIEDISKDDAFQYRLSTKTGDLLESLAREGQREPVDLVGPKPYRIVDGYRRVESVRQLGWKTVKAMVHRDMSNAEAQRMAFVKNVVRKNLSPLDKANAIFQAKRHGRSEEALAKDFGISTKQLKRYEELLDLPAGLQSVGREERASRWRTRRCWRTIGCRMWRSGWDWCTTATCRRSG